MSDSTLPQKTVELPSLRADSPFNLWINSWKPDPLPMDLVSSINKTKETLRTVLRAPRPMNYDPKAGIAGFIASATKEFKERHVIPAVNLERLRKTGKLCLMIRTAGSAVYSHMVELSQATVKETGHTEWDRAMHVGMHTMMLLDHLTAYGHWATEVLRSSTSDVPVPEYHLTTRYRKLYHVVYGDEYEVLWSDLRKKKHVVDIEDVSDTSAAEAMELQPTAAISENP